MGSNFLKEAAGIINMVLAVANTVQCYHHFASTQPATLGG